MTNQDMIAFLNAASTYTDSNEGSITFRYALAHNTRVLKGYYEDYTKALQSLINEYGEKDEDGTLVFEHETDAIPRIENAKAFEMEMKELLRSKPGAELKTVALDDLPQDATANTLQGLEPMIE